MTDTLVDRLRAAARWSEDQNDSAPAWDALLAEAAGEIERLREQNTGLGVRIQDAWKRIEALEEASAAVVLDFDKGTPGDATPDDLIEALRNAVTRASTWGLVT